MPEEQKDGGEVYPNGSWGGITRRDWLAGLAMQGTLSDGKSMDELFILSQKKEETLSQLIAISSYEFADAMIAESNK